VNYHFDVLTEVVHMPGGHSAPGRRPTAGQISPHGGQILPNGIYELTLEGGEQQRVQKIENEWHFLANP